MAQDIALAVASEPGRLDARNGCYVLALLDAAMDGCLADGGPARYAGMVTAPVQKSTINDAGIPFTGHTEYLAERSGTSRVVMMLAGPQPAHGNAMLRVALATTHLPLRSCPMRSTCRCCWRRCASSTLTCATASAWRGRASQSRGSTRMPARAARLGREIDVIVPALQRAVDAGIDARGPYPADTLFQPRHLGEADCVLAMYHDQGLAR